MESGKARPVLLEGAEWVRVDSVGVEVLRKGQGRPLLYLHGMDGLEGSLDLIDRLAGSFEVLAPAHPGFGVSELPSRFSTVDDLAYFYLDLVEAYGLRDAVLVGVSFGGWIAAEMLIKNSGAFSRAVLGAPLGLAAADRDRSDMRDIFMMMPAAADQMQQATKLPAPGERDEAQHLRTFRNREAVGLFGWSPYLNDPKLKQRLHRVAVPTLVAWGAEDALLPSKYGALFADAVPGASLEIIEGCGHRINVDRPAQLAALVARQTSKAQPREVRHARLAV